MKLNAETFECWQHRFDEIEKDLQVIVNDVAIYNSFMDVVNSNLEHLSANNGDIFIRFVRRCYGDRIALGVRRHSKNRDKLSFGKLLKQIEECSSQFTRQFYMEQFSDHSGIQPLLDLAYDRFTTAGGDEIDKCAIKDDRDSLANLANIVSDYVDTHVAHRDHNKTPSPTYDDLENAVEELNRLICKYLSLIKCVGCETLVATAQDDWCQVFSVPFDFGMVEE